MSCATKPALDVLIRNGWVADGTGNPLYPADIAISGDRIVEVGHVRSDVTAARVIDARGKIVCPGFVGAHSHTDRSIHTNPTAESTIRQGITTEVVGNCGSSNAPAVGPAREAVQAGLKRVAYEGPVTWTSFGECLDALDTMGTSPNLVCYVGPPPRKQRRTKGRRRSSPVEWPSTTARPTPLVG